MVSQSQLSLTLCTSPDFSIDGNLLTEVDACLEVVPQLKSERQY